MLPLYCRLPNAKVKRRFDEVSKVAVVAGPRQSSGLSEPPPEVWRHRLRFMLKHVLRVDVDDPLNPVDRFHCRLDAADDCL